MAAKVPLLPADWRSPVAAKVPLSSWTGTAPWQLKSYSTGPAPWQVRSLLPGRWHHPVVAKPAGSASFRGWVAAPCGAYSKPPSSQLADAMARARDIAARLEELSRQRQDQELQDLHQALTWAFENSQSQYSKINCFCDQPTVHMDKLPGKPPTHTADVRHHRASRPA